MRKTFLAFLTFSACALFFTACGDDSTTSSENQYSSSSVNYDAYGNVVDEFGNIIMTPNDPGYPQPGIQSSSSIIDPNNPNYPQNPQNPQNPLDPQNPQNPIDGTSSIGGDLPASSSSILPESSSSVVRIDIPDLCQGKANYTQVQAPNGNGYLCYEQKTLFAIATYDDLDSCDNYYMGSIAFVADEEEPYTCVETHSWRHGIFEVDLNPVQIAPGAACPDSLAGKEIFSAELNGSYACQGGIWVLTKSFERSSSSMHQPVAVDYSKGRAMNKRLGKGINFGNSWDATGSGDGGWSNPINDGDFGVIKAAGFNSVRIPVRWNHKNSSDMAAIKADVQTAISQGLVVIINYHHYDALNEVGANYAKDPSAYKSQYEQEKQNFINKWKEVAREMDQFPDNSLILEVWNEPTISSAAVVNELMLAGYNAIRSVTKTKTIMFEAYHAAKFYDLDKFDFPADGNIIYSGHYYEPFAFSHQGHGYDCKGDAAYKTTAAADMKSYLEIAKKYYPDVDGVNTIPLNMGEFGIAGQCGVSDSKRAQWTKEAVKAAESVGMSWTYWCFKNCGGFEAWSGNWKSGFLDAFGL